MYALIQLYQTVVIDIKNQGDLQVTGTTIKVLDNKKKDKAHLGYYWVYDAPISKFVMFDYSPTRANSAALPILQTLEAICKPTVIRGTKSME